MGIDDTRSDQHVMSDEATPPGAEITIRELILQVQKRTGLGTPELAKRAQRAGQSITRQTIDSLVAGRFTRYPNTDMIRGLSEALGVEAWEIVDALTVSLGLHVYVPTTIDDNGVTLISREYLLPAQAQAARKKVRAAAEAELARIARERNGR